MKLDKNEYQRAWAKANPDKIRAYAKSWRLRNPDKIRAYVQKWKATHPEKVISSYATAEERERSYGKKDSKGEIYETCREYKRRWQRLNPEKRRAHGRVHRALKKGILVRQPCWCGEERVHAHHPNGYENSLDVVWLCPAHHREKHRAES